MNIKEEKIDSLFDDENDINNNNKLIINNNYEDDEDERKYQSQNNDLRNNIYNSRNYFNILCYNNFIPINKNSLDKIFYMTDSFPEEYIYFNYNNNNNYNTNNEMFSYNIDENDIDEGFKKVETLEEYNKDTFNKCFWFFLFLIFCAFWDFLYFLYMELITIYKKHFFAIYTILLTILLIFTGIFGIIKCKRFDFSGYVLKISTISTPVCVLIGIIIYLSSDIELQLYWVKIIIDLISMVLGIILILFITGIIKDEIIINNNKEVFKENLINNDKNNNKETIIKF